MKQSVHEQTVDGAPHTDLSLWGCHGFRVWEGLDVDCECWDGS